MRRRVIILLLILDIPFSQSLAIGELRTAGAIQAGMGFNSVSMINVYSIYNNQATGAFIERPSIGLYYTPVSIGQGVNNIAAVIAVPIKKAGTIGLSTGYFGYELFNEKRLGLAYAIKLAKFISIGTQLDWINTSIQGYGSKNFVTFEMGLFARPIEELTFGVHIYNPLKLYVDEATNDKLPSILKIGAAYQAIKKFYINLEVEQEFGKKTRIRVGLDYTYKELISFRAGVATDPTIATVGVGVNLKQGLHIDFATSYNTAIGFNPHIGLWYEFKKKYKK